MKLAYFRDILNEFKKPCVYRCLDKDGKPLYIGSSAFGFSRVFVNPAKSHKTRAEAMTVCHSLEIEFFKNVEDAYDKECQEIHKWHPSGQNCPICAAESKIGGARPETLARHVETARRLVQDYGYIPTDTWLVKNGHADLAMYARIRSKLFQEFPKLKRRQGRPKKT